MRVQLQMPNETLEYNVYILYKLGQHYDIGTVKLLTMFVNNSYFEHFTSDGWHIITGQHWYFTG